MPPELEAVCTGALGVNGPVLGVDVVTSAFEGGDQSATKAQARVVVEPAVVPEGRLALQLVTRSPICVPVVPLVPLIGEPRSRPNVHDSVPTPEFTQLL